MNSSFQETCKQVRVIPVIAIDRLDDAVPLAEALVAGGLKILEVTLRTPVALEAIKLMKQVTGACVGAGTILHPQAAEQAQKAGAEFLVSPGATPSLLAQLKNMQVDFLPGVANPSDIMQLLDFGIDFMKFFPAEINGGIPAIKAFQGPFAGVQFCPTGGIDKAKAPEYLNLQNVVCVGGTWILDKQAIAAQDWETIQKLAVECASL